MINEVGLQHVVTKDRKKDETSHERESHTEGCL